MASDLSWLLSQHDKHVRSAFYSARHVPDCGLGSTIAGRAEPLVDGVMAGCLESVKTFENFAQPTVA